MYLKFWQTQKWQTKFTRRPPVPLNLQKNKELQDNKKIWKNLRPNAFACCFEMKNFNQFSCGRKEENVTKVSKIYPYEKCSARFVICPEDYQGKNILGKKRSSLMPTLHKKTKQCQIRSSGHFRIRKIPLQKLIPPEQSFNFFGWEETT